jgi:plasmid stabilization system protein ParE
MPQGDKSSYTDKQKRKAGHIEEGYRKRGVSKGEAEERAWRTVNKQDGGAKKKTSSRGKSISSSSRSSSRKSGGAKKRTTRSRKRT